MKKIIALLCVISLIIGIFPIPIFAKETMAADSTIETEITDVEVSSDQSNSLGELGGYLAGNALTTKNLFAEHKFSFPTGFGFAAEHGNNLIDRTKNCFLAPIAMR